MQTGLELLLQSNSRAAEYYASLHPSVQAMVHNHADEINTQEELISIANNSMTGLLREYGGIYDDSDTYPN